MTDISIAAPPLVSAQPARSASAVADAGGFRRSERLVVIMGACALGAALGFVAAMSIGRVEEFYMRVSGCAAFVLAFGFCFQVLREAVQARAYGCATALTLHAAGLGLWAWALLGGAAMSPLLAPLPAFASLVLFASCWSGGAGGVYRVGGQALLVGAIGGFQALFSLMAG